MSWKTFFTRLGVWMSSFFPELVILKSTRSEGGVVSHSEGLLCFWTPFFHCVNAKSYPTICAGWDNQCCVVCLKDAFTPVAFGGYVLPCVLSHCHLRLALWPVGMWQACPLLRDLSVHTPWIWPVPKTRRIIIMLGDGKAKRPLSSVLEVSNKGGVKQSTGINSSISDTASSIISFANMVDTTVNFFSPMLDCYPEEVTFKVKPHTC